MQTARERLLGARRVVRGRGGACGCRAAPRRAATSDTPPHPGTHQHTHAHTSGPLARMVMVYAACVGALWAAMPTRVAPRRAAGSRRRADTSARQPTAGHNRPQSRSRPSLVGSACECALCMRSVGRHGHPSRSPPGCGIPATSRHERPTTHTPTSGHTAAPLGCAVIVWELAACALWAAMPTRAARLCAGAPRRRATTSERRRARTRNPPPAHTPAPLARSDAV
jgi:hypothetical protein